MQKVATASLGAKWSIRQTARVVLGSQSYRRLWMELRPRVRLWMISTTSLVSCRGFAPALSILFSSLTLCPFSVFHAFNACTTTLLSRLPFPIPPIYLPTFQQQTTFSMVSTRRKFKELPKKNRPKSLRSVQTAPSQFTVPRTPTKDQLPFLSSCSSLLGL